MGFRRVGMYKGWDVKGLGCIRVGMYKGYRGGNGRLCGGIMGAGGGCGVD